MKTSKKLNLTATILLVTALLLGCLTLSGGLQELIRAIYSDLHPYDADDKYWPIQEAVLWIIPIFFLVSFALSIWSVSLRRSRYGIFLVVISSIFVLLCAFCLWFAWEMGRGMGNP